VLNVSATFQMSFLLISFLLRIRKLLFYINTI